MRILFKTKVHRIQSKSIPNEYPHDPFGPTVEQTLKKIILCLINNKPKIH